MLGTHNTFDNVIWSLTFEMRISLFFPLIVLPLIRWRALASITLVILLTVLTHLLWQIPGHEHVAGMLFGTLRYSALFVIGAATVQYADNIRRQLTRMPAARLGFAPWICLLAGLWMMLQPWPYEPILVDGIAGVLIIVSAILPGPIESFLRRPAARELGRISYSLYLIHVPVLLVMIYTLDRSIPRPLILICVPLVSILVAWVFNRLVEEPSARLGRWMTTNWRVTRTALTTTA